MIASQQRTPPSQRKSADPLLDQSGFAVERLPMLRVIFDELATSLVEGLRLLCRAPTMFSVDAIATGDLFEVLATSRESVGAVLHSPELDCRSLAIFDRSFVLSLVQILLGGDASDAQEQPDRPFTRIEMNLLQKISELTAKSLQSALTGIIETSFKLERQETLVDTTILGRRDAPVVTANILFQASGMRGTMTIVIPQAALQPVRQKLARELSNESAAGDPRWARQMQTGVSFAEIAVKGVLEEIPMTLGEVAAFEIGHVLKLRGSGMGRVRLECGEHDLFWCKLSQADGRYSLEIQEPIVKEKDILDDLILS
ncbi:flagellar motor switch protein FliM [Methylocapsa sp. S129]|uniref:flagellar motor switch protein FliM n=1 Tax=Methylocapsa sp. S129 TaxID=1641869 RepID=UPI00131E972B|nr:flagellar motor switch protein FliM [Methylocapsa sp. S129]